VRSLFLLAHPDDETVAAGGTIRRLADNGDEVIVVLATKGEAGEGSEKRLKEFREACKILGIKEIEILKYKDGRINNQIVWGSLELDFIDQIEKHKPEVVVTFDHSGWYFHLDHVGVSLAALRAVQRAKHKVEALLFTLFHPPGIKIRWPYVYQEKLPVTHEVDIKKVLKAKVAAVKAHRSQKMRFLPFLRAGRMNKEYFQLVLASQKGKRLFENDKIFKKI
jgi:LmbE family N-acetylglucosaminyl deacetylase